MKIVCFVLSGLCLAYYLLIVTYAGITADFAWFWPALALVLAGAGGVIWMSRSRGGAWIHIRTGVGICAAVGVLALVILGGMVVSGMREKGSKDLDYLVVLGAQVKGDRPSRALLKRLKAAGKYAQDNSRTRLILSGGQGPGENITEAQCMADWLQSQGISPDRLVLEDRSTSTRENLEFSDQLTGCASARTGIVTNDFHVYRALKTARKYGYTQAEGIAAAGDPIMEVHYIVRECFALVKGYLTRSV